MAQGRDAQAPARAAAASWPRSRPSGRRRSNGGAGVHGAPCRRRGTWPRPGAGGSSSRSWTGAGRARRPRPWPAGWRPSSSSCARPTVDLVDRRAWLAQLRRTGLEARQALIGWADTQRKIGKGTGKRAPALQLQGPRAADPGPRGGAGLDHAAGPGGRELRPPARQVRRGHRRRGQPVRPGRACWRCTWARGRSSSAITSRSAPRPSARRWRTPTPSSASSWAASPTATSTTARPRSTTWPASRFGGHHRPARALPLRPGHHRVLQPALLRRRDPPAARSQHRPPAARWSSTRSPRRWRRPGGARSTTPRPRRWPRWRRRPCSCPSTRARPSGPSRCWATSRPARIQELIQQLVPLRRAGAAALRGRQPGPVPGRRARRDLPVDGRRPGRARPLPHAGAPHASSSATTSPPAGPATSSGWCTRWIPRATCSRATCGGG